MNPPEETHIGSSHAVLSRPLGWLSGHSGGFGLLIVCEIAVLMFSHSSTYYTSVVLEWITFALLAQGFNLIAGYGGRLAFGNVMFFGIASYLVVAGALHHWYPELIGMVVAVVICAALAYLLSLILWRVNGLLFALATFALATMLGQLVTVFSIFGKSSGLQEPLAVNTSVLHLAFTSQFTYMIIGAVLVLLAAAATAWFGHSTVGREVQATRDDRIAASTSGIKARHVTAVAWTLSAVISALAGVFYAQYNLFVEPTSAFGLSSITLIVVPAILGGMGTLWGPVVGSIIIPVGLLLNRMSSGHGVASLNLLVYGAILVVVLRVYPGGLVSGIGALFRGRRASRSRSESMQATCLTSGVQPESAKLPAIKKPAASSEPKRVLLEVTDVRKHFGGVQALQGVTFSVGHGEMVGLLGPNGAGKSTLFNCIAGVERADSGAILIAGDSITACSAHQRARLGIARTYQTIRLFPNLTALENVAVGTLRRSGSKAAEARAGEMLEAVGLQADRKQVAGALSLVDQRRVELARAMVSDARLVMLDEVMTGLDESEVDDMRRVVQNLNTDHSTSFVIVEHVMGHILPLISRVVIMVQGAVLADGHPDEILERTDVLEAYFGRGRQGSMSHDA